VRGVGEQRRWQRLARVMSGVDPQAMASVELHRISARDGRELPVWLTVPPGRQAAKAGAGGPAVVLVHGGPWLRGGQWEWRALEQFLASRGFLVIAPEFRGSTGYGHAHFRAGFRQWGRAMQDDLLDAAAWARSQGWADRFCIAGGSYGGYATLMGLARDGDFWRCGAAWAAVADLPLFLKGSLSVGDDVSEDGRRHTLPVMVGDPKMDAAMLDAVSPVKLAAQMRAPLLLAWGERDQRVPLAHADRLRRALREAGRPEPLWVSYPDEGHSWLQPENQIDFARRLEAFFNEHLRPAAGRPTEPPPMR
jgi:dipeptidyl aminopeptidase/acylaminoacyl peptidase